MRMMTYYKPSPKPHDIPPLTGILLVNLGTPDAPTPAAVRRYLAEFLWDRRVVEFPRALWWLVLHGIILRLRPARVARLYKKVWTEKGSPLLHFTQALGAGVAKTLGPNQAVQIAMRYGNPSIPAALEQWRDKNLQRLLVIPLYPQYSATTTATAFDAISRELQTWRNLPEVRFCMHYHDQPHYITALANSIRASFAQHGTPQQLLFSFHGIPQRYFDAGDPYYCHCHKTARLVAEQLALTKEQWQMAFQSRFGREPWLQPYMDATLKQLPQQQITNVQIIAPGFAVDCLETLEELAMQNRELFLHAGGKAFHYIPALNDSAEHVALLAELIRQHTANW